MLLEECVLLDDFELLGGCVLLGECEALEELILVVVVPFMYLLYCFTTNLVASLSYIAG